jgi:acetylglutamate kinase
LEIQKPFSKKVFGGFQGQSPWGSFKIMEITNAQRAEVLVKALPYIQKYTGKIVVIKYGGNAMINEELKGAVMGDLALLSLIGVKIVLVHGGGPEISETMKRMGKESVFVNGLRVTDRETAEIVQMVLSGKINKSLVNLLNNAGCRSVGLSGADDGLIEAVQKDPQLGYVGEITKVNPTIIHDLLDKGYIPVISTVGYDKAGNIYNINADTAAARIAGALKAEALFTMTDIAGILRDKDDPSSLIQKIYVSDAPGLMRDGIISGGMIPKVDCCVEAIRRGVKRVFIIDGRVPHSILIEALTDEGIGTMFL